MRTPALTSKPAVDTPPTPRGPGYSRPTIRRTSRPCSGCWKGSLLVTTDRARGVVMVCSTSGYLIVAASEPSSSC